MLHFALIGIGKFGKNYLRILQNMPDVELVALAAASENSLAEIAVSDGVKKTINTEEVFNDSNIDAVVIATPTETHFALAVAALNRGKHVLLEKPMTATLEEAEELAKIAEMSGKILMIGHQYCYNDHIRLLKQKVDEGFFGNLRYIYVEHFYTRPLAGQIGCFWETATHELAILDYLFGEFSIGRQSARFEDFLKKGRDDFANVSFSLHSVSYSNVIKNIGIRNLAQSDIPQGRTPVTIVTSWCAPEKVRRLSVVGEKGAAIFDEVRDSQKPLRLYENTDGVNYREISAFIENPREPLQNELEHFIACLNEQKQVLTDYSHGLRVTTYLDILMRG